MIKVYQNSQDLLFTCGGQLAGQYRYTDSFKPHIHPLHSPRGHCVTLAGAYDHKHHKGVMYALREKGVNFWEETEITPADKVGRQRHDSFEKIIDQGREAGFVEKLTWLSNDSSEVYFTETRSVFCQYDGTRSAYLWTWATNLEAQKEMTLIKSNWSEPLSNGQKVNYHGMAIRFAWNFVGTIGWNVLKMDGKALPMSEGMGRKTRSVELIGNMDGGTPIPKVSVKMENDSNYMCYVRDMPFPFYSLGPSNESEVTLKKGDVIKDSYKITVQDL